MDIMAVVAILAPALPFLMRLGERAAESAAEKLGEDVWKKANEIWAKLRPQVEAKPMAQGAARELSENPDNEEARELLAKQLANFFEADKALAKEIAQIIQEESSRAGSSTGTDDTSIWMTVSGNDNLSVGQVSGSGKVIRDVRGPLSIDESRDKVSVSADRGGQVAGGNATRSGAKVLSGNTLSFILIGIVALGGVAWMLGVRVGPQGIELETQGGQSPQPTDPSERSTTNP